MRLLKYAAILSVAMSLTNFVYAKDNVNPTPTYQVPFYNVALNGGQKIYVKYDFRDDTQTLVCKKSGDAMDMIRWEHKDVKYKAQLPIVLKAHESFEGQWADSFGKLTIANIFSENPSINVSCEYRNMK